MDDFTMARDDDLFAEVDLKDSSTLRELVAHVHSPRDSAGL
jgi:hypothetical protein